MGDPDVFAREVWTQRPQHLQAAGSFEDLLSLDGVDRVVSTLGLRLPAFRLVKDGDTLPPARYTKTTRTGSQEATGVIDARAVFAEFDAGATLVFQSMHRYWEPLADYCRSLEIALGHPVQANAYITPPGARGFDAHEDSHDVFVLQSYGAKRWQIHDRHDLPPGRPPLIDAIVASGDTLYIPAGFPHSASTQERASAHITIGILALRWSDLLKETARLLETDPVLDESLPLRFANDDGSFTEEVHRRLQRLSSSVAGVDPEIIARRLRRRVLTTRQPLLRGQIHRLLTLDEVDDKTTVGRRMGSICVLDRVDGELSVLLGDRELRLPLHAEPAMSLVAAEKTFVVGDLPGLDEAGRLVLVKRLIREGLLEVVV